MEYIAKLVKAIFFDDNGEVSKSTVSKIKDFLLVLFIVEHLLIGGMLYFFDDDDDTENVELVDQNE